MIRFEKPPSGIDDSAYYSLIDAAWQAPRYKELLSLTVTGEFRYSNTELPRFRVDIREATDLHLVPDPTLGSSEDR